MEGHDLAALDLHLDRLHALVHTLLDDRRVRAAQREQLLQRASIEAEEISAFAEVEAQRLQECAA